MEDLLDILLTVLFPIAMLMLGYLVGRKTLAEDLNYLKSRLNYEEKLKKNLYDEISSLTSANRELTERIKDLELELNLLKQRLEGPSEIF